MTAEATEQQSATTDEQTPTQPEQGSTEQSSEVATTEPTVVLDEFGMMAKTRLTDQIRQRNEVATTLAAASKDRNAVLVDLRETSQDDKVVKIRTKIEELTNRLANLEAQRDEILNPLVDEAIASAKGNVDELTTKVDAFDKTIKAGVQYLRDLYGEGATNDLPALVGKRKATGATSGGETQRRIRGFDFYVTGADGNETLATGPGGTPDEKKSNLAAAAKVVGIDTSDVREQFWAAAGTKDSSQYPDEVRFHVRNGKGEEYTVRAVRKPEDA